ncbi:MAG: 50S ribosomal protein L25 [Calditrichaeota bacterium]|nr:50S ribosomal protein L25 [Calditrichota bacterium]
MTTTDITLSLQSRSETGKENAKRLRREGKVPGVFYAHGEKTVPVVVGDRELAKVISQVGGLVDIKIDDRRKRKAIIKEVQSDPVTNKFYHVDIMGVRLKEKVTVTVPIQVVGDAIGVKEQGGILHQYSHEIEVSCLPLDIPDHVEIDVTDLNIGDSISVADIQLENAAIVNDPDQPLATVMAPSVSKEPEAEEEAEEEVAEGEEEEKTEEQE